MNVVATNMFGMKRKKRRRKIGIIFVLIITVIAAVYSTHQGQKGTGNNTDLTRNLGTGNIKTNIGLANFAWNALDCRSGYVFGATGQTVTPEFLRLQANRFAGNSRANLNGSELNDIYRKYAGRPAFDCIGLIKAYSWIDEKTGEISSLHKNAMPDCTANGIFAYAPIRGPVEFMPEIPGLAVQMNGHIGVYVGNGEVIEARGNRIGVSKTKLRGRGWKWYLMVPSITYADSGTYLIHGRQVTIQNGKAVKSKVIPSAFNGQ